MIKREKKVPVVWEEVFNSFGAKLDKDTVIHVAVKIMYRFG